MALAGAAWSQLDHVVVAFNEGNHAYEANQLATLRQRRRLETDATQEKPFPLFGREVVPATFKRIQDVGFG